MIVEETDPGLEYTGHDAGGGATYQYNGLPFTGVMICRYSDGTIFQEISHVNGYENGPSINSLREHSGTIFKMMS